MSDRFDPSSPDDRETPERDPQRDPLAELLKQARAPELPAAAQRRLKKVWNEVTPARPKRAIWKTPLTVGLTLVAAMALVGPCTVMFEPGHQPEVSQKPPAQTVTPTDEPTTNPAGTPTESPTESPRVEPALPGRKATPLEATLMRQAMKRQVSTPIENDRVEPSTQLATQPTTQPATQPTTRPSAADRIDAALTAVAAGEPARQVARSLLDIDARTLDERLIAPLTDAGATPEKQSAARALLLPLATPATVTRLIDAGEVYDDAADMWLLREPVIAALAELLPVDMIVAEIEEPTLAANKGHILLAVLAQSTGEGAAEAMLDLVPMDPNACRIAAARMSDRVALTLLRTLDDPRIDRRNAAAWLLSATTDERVIRVLEGMLLQSRRSEAARALLLSDQPSAAAIVRRAMRDPNLSALIRSLENQDLSPAALALDPNRTF